MSYERRLEIEALPAEKGWGKWQGIIGHGTEFVERKWLEPMLLWIGTGLGPLAVSAYRYERWRFAEDKKPVDKHFVTYTVWHTDTTYTDYSPRAEAKLDMLCAETSEELCEKARTLLDAEISSLEKALSEKQATRNRF